MHVLCTGIVNKLGHLQEFSPDRQAIQKGAGIIENIKHKRAAEQLFATPWVSKNVDEKQPPHITLLPSPGPIS